MINSECELPSLAKTTKEKIEMIMPSMEKEKSDVKDLYCPCFDKDVATYIGGYVVRRLKKDIHCSDCTTGFLIDTPKTKSLTSIRDQGGLNYLHEDIEKVFIVAERQLSFSLSLTNILEDNFFVERNAVKVSNKYHSQQSTKSFKNIFIIFLQNSKTF